MSSCSTIICIDGLIGAGKTTLLKKLAKYYPCFTEPLKEWTLLPYLYKNSTSYGPCFQFQVLLSQFNQKQLFPNGLVLVERCPWTSRNIFAPFYLDDDALRVYDKLYQTLAYKVDYFIYLDVDPLEAYRRIHNRSQLDSGISLDYLQRLYKSYQLNLLMGRSNVFVVNGTTHNVEQTVKNCLENIKI